MDKSFSFGETDIDGKSGQGVRRRKEKIRRERTKEDLRRQQVLNPNWRRGKAKMNHTVHRKKTRKK